MTFLDASAIVAIFLNDAHSAAMGAWLVQGDRSIAVSTFAAA